jgi:hypothetical protein
MDDLGDVPVYLTELPGQRFRLHFADEVATNLALRKHKLSADRDTLLDQLTETHVTARAFRQLIDVALVAYCSQYNLHLETREA